MGIGKYIRSGVGLLGKTAMNYANGLTGGIAGQVLDKATDLVSNNAGLIGKVARNVGKSFLDENTRNAISSFTDKAMKYIPEGKIKTALSKVNNVAQGRDANYSPKGGFSISNMSNMAKKAANAVASTANTVASTAKVTQPLAYHTVKGVASVGKGVGKLLGKAATSYVNRVKEVYKDPLADFRRIGNFFRRKPNNNTPASTPQSIPSAVHSATPTVPTQITNNYSGRFVV